MTMSENNDQTNPGRPEFDFSRYPFDTLFHERRTGRDRRDKDAANRPARDNTVGRASARPERRAKKDRRRRIDPTTFDKQYTDDEMEFMNAMQRFKERLGQELPDLSGSSQSPRRPGLPPRGRSSPTPPCPKVTSTSQSCSRNRPSTPENRNSPGHGHVVVRSRSTPPVRGLEGAQRRAPSCMSAGPINTLTHAETALRVSSTASPNLAG